MSRVPVPAARKGLLNIRGPRASGNGASTPRAGPSGSGSSASRGPAAKGGDDGYLYLAGVRDGSGRVTEFSSDKDRCPVCHTDRQFNPTIRLLVSPCYHRMCTTCIDRYFAGGPEPCPTCGRLLRKLNFQHQTFEDLKVEREVSVRRRMADYFNKRESDFGSKREYDDYLEKVEEWTFNLLNEVDVDATEAAIASYRADNAASIAANQEKASLEAMSQTERDAIERAARQQRMLMVEEAERVERTEEERVRVEIVDALARGATVRAQEIREAHEAARAARAANLARALPGMGGAEEGEEGEERNETNALGYDYVGPYVPIPYADPEALEYRAWYSAKNVYLDGRNWVRWMKDDPEGRVRGGGWDVDLFWNTEVESAVMSLGIEPLA